MQSRIIMLISIIFFLFAIKDAIAGGYVRKQGKARFTIRRLMYANLPEAYLEIDEKQVKKTQMQGKHCFEQCLKTNKKKIGTCAYARLDVYAADFEHPEVQHAPFEQVILMSRVRHCWLYGPAQLNEETTEYVGKGAIKKETGEEGRHILAAFIIETKKTPFPEEPYHPDFPHLRDDIEIVDQHFNEYLAQPPAEKCNDYIRNWPKMDDPADRTTTLSVRRGTETNEMVTKAVAMVKLLAYTCGTNFFQQFAERCSPPTVRYHDIILASEPIAGCESIGIGSQGGAITYQTTDASKAQGWCVKEAGCGGAAVAIGTAQMQFNQLKMTALTSGDDINHWCYAFNVISNQP